VTVVAAVALAGLGFSVALYLFSMTGLALVRRTSRRRDPGCFAPPVSIIKPLAGLDEGLEKNLESYFRLDYPEYEVIFSFARPEDPALRVARSVADRHPDVPATFVVDAREPGSNSKVNRLSAGLRHARHPYLLMADGNARVRSDFLSRAIAPFWRPSVGLVSHLFRGVGARSLGSRLETLYLNAVLQPATAAISRVLRRPCVVGKSILIARYALEAIGGFPALESYLAEDFVVGEEMLRAGFEVVLSGDVLDTVEQAKNLRAAWARQRRWILMRRRLAGPAYASELFSAPLPWFVLLSLAGRGNPALVLAGAALLTARYGLEILGMGLLLGSWRIADAPLLPLRDLAVFALFWAGVFGRRTRWRGRRVALGPRTLILPEAVSHPGFWRHWLPGRFGAKTG
jgi:ceramide glucosyltransferase